MSADYGPLDSTTAFAYSAVDPLEQYLALTILGDNSAKDLSASMALSHVLARLRRLQSKVSSGAIYAKIQHVIDQLVGTGGGSINQESESKVKVKVKDEPEPETPATFEQAGDSKVNIKKEVEIKEGIKPEPSVVHFEADVNDTILLLLLGDGPFLIGSIGLGVLRQRLIDLMLATNSEDIEEYLNSQIVRLLDLNSEHGLLKLFDV